MSRHTFGLAVRAMIFFHSAKPPLSPSFYPHSLVSDIRSVLGGCSRFSRCCYLISVLSSHLFGGNWAPGVSRSHLVSAVELGCSDQNFLGHGTHGLLAIAQWFVYLAAHPQPMGAVPPTFAPRPPLLVSWRFSLLARQASVPISADDGNAGGCRGVRSGVSSGVSWFCHLRRFGARRCGWRN